MNTVIRFTSVFFAIILLIALILVLFFSEIPHCAARKEIFTPEIILLVSGLFFIYIVYWVVTHSRFKKVLPLCWLTGICFCLVQMWAVYHYYFITGWDVNVILSNTFCIALGEDYETTYIHYFSLYPNNLFLLYLFSRIGILWAKLELSVYWLFEMILFVQCVLSFCTGILVFFIARKLLLNDHQAFFCFLLYIFLVGLSPWVSIPYSDSMALFFPSAILFLYLWHPYKKLFSSIRWFSIGFLAFAGYRIKPTVIIVLIAIVIIYTLHTLLYLQKEVLSKYILSTVMILSGMLMAFLLIQYAVDSISMPVNPEDRFGIAHFFC